MLYSPINRLAYRLCLAGLEFCKWDNELSISTSVSFLYVYDIEFMHITQSQNFLFIYLFFNEVLPFQCKQNCVVHIVVLITQKGFQLTIFNFNELFLLD